MLVESPEMYMYDFKSGRVVKALMVEIPRAGPSSRPSSVSSLSRASHTK